MTNNMTSIANNLVAQQENKIAYINNRLKQSNEPYNEIQLGIAKQVAEGKLEVLKQVLQAQK